MKINKTLNIQDSKSLAGGQIWQGIEKMATIKDANDKLN